MKNIQAGNKVCIEYQDWINKSLAIRALRINVYSNETEILESIEWPFDVFPNDLEKGLKNMFPWATFENDFTEDDEDDENNGENNVYKKIIAVIAIAIVIMLLLVFVSIFSELTH